MPPKPLDDRLQELATRARARGLEASPHELNAVAARQAENARRRGRAPGDLSSRLAALAAQARTRTD
jgi:hypothetical protein